MLKIPVDIFFGNNKITNLLLMRWYYLWGVVIWFKDFNGCPT